MHIARARVRNYRGFLDTGALEFGPGFNLVIGRNNSGKSILLAGLAQRIAGDPHRSAESVASIGMMPDQTTLLDLDFVLSGKELLNLALRTTTELILPAPQNFSETDGAWQVLLTQLFDERDVRLRVRWRMTPTAGPSPEIAGPSARLEFSQLLDASGQARCGLFDITKNRKNYEFRGVHLANPGQDSYVHLAGTCRELIYRFDAERLNIGHGPFGASRVLVPNAANLPEVLGNLQTEKDRMAEYLALVGEVLPEVRDVIVFPLSNIEQEVRVSSLPANKRRSDLAVPLLRCGSGVSQVLAILYVIIMEDESRTLLVDEPNSFLHPGASRALMAIFRRNARHQYVIATHSPEIVSGVLPAATSLLTWANEQCSVKQFEATDEAIARSALDVLGARLSDVFGYDQVVWCEGPSDAECWRLVLKAFFPATSGTVIVPVRSTGSFTRRHIEEAIDVYSRLSKSSALVPPTVGFVFDRDNKSEDDCRDLEKRSDAKIRILNVRMIENFMLDAGAIGALIRSLDASLTYPNEEFAAWLSGALKEQKYFEGLPGLVGSVGLPHMAHAKQLLNDCVIHFTDGRHVYLNTRDTPFLARYLMEKDAQRFADAAAVLGQLLGVPMM